MFEFRRSLMLAGLIVFIVAAGGCTPPEPNPSLNSDLGSGGEFLLPTPPAWHDKSVVRGQAEWKSFRKPAPAVTAEAASGGEGVAGATATAAPPGSVEEEIHGLIDDFNGLVKDAKYKEAVEYLIDDQTAIAEQAIEVLPAFEKKLNEVAEAMPGAKEGVGKLVKEMSLAKVFAIDVTDLRQNGTVEVVGVLATPDAQTAAPAATVRFVKKGDKGDWFIESPRIAALSQVLPAIQNATTGLDALLASVKSGALSGPQLDAQATALNEALGKVLSGAAPARGDAKPAGAPAGDSKPEAPPEEPPTKPKEPATGG